MPLGLSSRHLAAASISKKTGCIAIIVSESSIVRIFIDGDIVFETIPEVWLLKRYSIHLGGPYSKHNHEEMTVFDKITIKKLMVAHNLLNIELIGISCLNRFFQNQGFFSPCS